MPRDIKVRRRHRHVFTPQFAFAIQSRSMKNFYRTLCVVLVIMICIESSVVSNGTSTERVRTPSVRVLSSRTRRHRRTICARFFAATCQLSPANEVCLLSMTTTTTTIIANSSSSSR